MNIYEFLMGVFVAVCVGLFIYMIAFAPTVTDEYKIVDMTFKDDKFDDNYHIVVMDEFGEKRSIELIYSAWITYEIGDNYTRTRTLPISEWF